MEELKKFTLQEVLNQSLEKYPDNNFLNMVDGEKLSFTEFGERVKYVRDFLKENGITKGDRVAILSENMPNWGVAYFAVTTMGAVLVPIMTEFHESEVHHCIRHSESKAIFISSKLFEKIDDVEFASLELTILIDDFSIVPPKTNSDIIKEIKKTGRKEFSKIVEKALKIVGVHSDEIEEEDLAAIIYTSGTTGHSKGVMLTHKNITYDAYTAMNIVNIDKSDKLLSILPLFHTLESTLGLVIPAIIGASVHYLDRPPTPAVLLPAMKKVQPTLILSVPLVIEKIYRQRVLPEIKKKFVARVLYKIPTIRKKINKAAGKKLIEIFGGKLKLFPIGGAALAADVEKFLIEAKFPFTVGYGLTETSPVASGASVEKARYKSSGPTLKGVTFKIDNPAPETGEGEIFIKGPIVMKGYYKDPEKTKEVLTEDGWFKTGDLGTIDKDGYVYIKGRSKNVIVGSSGKNIYPEEIESIINEQEFVSESLVYDCAGKICARVHLNYDQLDESFGVSNLKESETRKKLNELLNNIFKNVNERLSSFSKVNKLIEQIEPFEKTPTKKIKRYLYVD
ncbi:MAG: AMP-binding protein [Ignavibacteria bacterium]|jgi:long-chain acyl-CoA synthetase